jgi:hypothetical protein
MDVNQYFNVGINTIQPSGLRETSTPETKPFIPLGHSIVQHTEKLFSNKKSNIEQLAQLIKPDIDDCLDPGTFNSLTYSTMKAITQGLKAEKNHTNNEEIIELEAAVSVITELYHDQNMLKKYLAVLTLV